MGAGGFHDRGCPKRLSIPEPSRIVDWMSSSTPKATDMNFCVCGEGFAYPAFGLGVPSGSQTPTFSIQRREGIPHEKEITTASTGLKVYGLSGSQVASTSLGM